MSGGRKTRDAPHLRTGKAYNPPRGSVAPPHRRERDALMSDV
jgi:hypothetical protein